MRVASLAVFRKLSAGLLLVSGPVACTGDKSTPADTAAASPAPSPTTTWQSPVHGISPATIAAAMGNPGRWTSKPTEAERHCKGTQACDDHASPAKVKVRIWAETNAKNVVFGGVSGSTAVLIGKMQRMGAQTTLSYNLSNGRPHAVYLVDSLGTPYYEVWDVNGSIKTRVAAGKVTECNHTRDWNYSFAVFASCDTSPEEHLVAAPGASVVTWANSGAVGHNDGPAWFTCTSGCCTADLQ